MRTGKILGYIVGGVIALVALVLLAVWLLVNPDHYKTRIAAAVKDATGRDLVLQGDIKLSVFPWIALELGPASLGNPPGFGTDPFVSFQHAAVRARLWPLLHERLEVARLEIDGLDVRLKKNAEGKGNWEGFGRADGEAGESAGATPNAAGAMPGSGATPGAAQSQGVGNAQGAAARGSARGRDVPASGDYNPLQGLAGIRITHTHVSYEKFSLDNFNLETAPFADGVIPISISFDADRGVPSEHVTVNAKVAFSEPAAQHFRLAALTVIGQVSLAGNDRPVKWNLSLPGLDVDLDAQTLMAPAMSLTVAGAELDGRLQATHILGDVSAAGALSLAPLLVREFMPRLGLTPPQTRDPRAFSQVSGSATFTYGGDALHIENLQAALDDTHLRANLGVTNLALPALKFDVTVDRIDADRYLAPAGQPAAPAKPAAKAGEPSRPLQANGTVAIGSLHLSPLDLSNLKLTFAANEGLMHVFPLTAQIDGGQYSGDITLDSRGSVPAISMDEHLSGVDVGKLLASNAKRVHLSGKGTFSVKASGRGATADAVLKTLDGHVDANVADGAVEGIDLGYQLDRAEALLERQDAPAAQDTHRTPFATFKMSAAIADGVAQTRDLTISSAALRVTGQGSVNLTNQAVDFALLADTLRTVQGVPLRVPVKVTGTTSDPTIRPDIEALAKGALKQKVQDVLQDKLKGLFGKP